MKVKVLYEVRSGPWGGGNQFLKGLDKSFGLSGCSEAKLSDADIVLFNSHQYLWDLLADGLDLSRIVKVHRVAGPMRLYTSRNDVRDHLVNTGNSMLADGTIFQSLWSMENNLMMGLEKPSYWKVICNGSDRTIFHSEGRKPVASDTKIRLIATAWSPNPLKGYSTYQWLDHNLDFDRYNMVFCGNSPVEFKHIKNLGPLDSPTLADELRQSDVFISASYNDPCSNSVLEARACGMPVIVRNDGGHPEVAGEGGLLFSSDEELPGLIEKAVKDHDVFTVHPPPAIEDAASGYMAFFKELIEQRDKGELVPKTINNDQRAVLDDLIRRIAPSPRHYKGAREGRFHRMTRRLLGAVSK